MLPQVWSVVNFVLGAENITYVAAGKRRRSATIALTKINRSSQRDLADLELLARDGLITRDDLIAYYLAIAPFLGRGAYALVNPAVYDAKFQAVFADVWGP